MTRIKNVTEEKEKREREKERKNPKESTEHVKK